MKERRVYTAEFKREAVKLSEQTDVSVVQVAQELGVSDYSLTKWRKQAKVGGELAFLGNGKVSLTAEQQANVRLKKELGRGEFGAASAFVSGELSAGYTRDLTPDVDGDPGTGNFPRC